MTNARSAGGAIVGTLALVGMAAVAVAVAGYSFLDADRARAGLAAAQKRNLELADKNATQLEAVEYLATKIGHGEFTDVEALKQRIDADLARFGRESNYPLLVERLNLRVKTFTERSEILEQEGLKHKQRADSADGRHKAKFDEFERVIADKQKELLEERERSHQLLAKLEEQVASLQGKVEVANVKRRDAERDREVAVGKADVKIQSLKTAVRGLKQTMEAADSNDAIQRERAVGEVVAINSSMKLVTLSAGRKAGMRIGAKVRLFRKDPLGNPGKEVGLLEVAKLEDQSSIALIVRNEITEPILTGDMAFSLLANKTGGEIVGLVGFIDYDGDGEDDSRKLERMIEREGGKVGYRMTPEGTERGRITPQLTYIVMDMPEVADGQAEQKRGIVERLSNVRKEAADFGIQIIASKKFLLEIGHKLDRRTANP